MIPKSLTKRLEVIERKLYKSETILTLKPGESEEEFQLRQFLHELECKGIETLISESLKSEEGES